MKVSVTKKEHNVTELVIELPVEEVAKAYDKAYKKLVQQVNIPGFRKGKAPRKMIEKRVGEDGMRSEAFDFIIPDAYRQAVVDNNIETVGRPEVTDVTLNEGEPCVFTVSVITKPEVTLGDYKGLQVAAPVTEVTDEEVDKQINTLRDRHAKMVVAEGAELGQGDFALIDFDGTIDGKPFSGGQSKGYPLEVGSGSFIPGFEDQLIGAKAGEEREVKVTFPADYFVAELAGKDPWVDESEFAQNMERFVAFCLSQPRCRVVVVNIPRCCDRQYRQHPGARERTERYNRRLEQLTRNPRLALVDAQAVFAELGEVATGSDGVHPTAQCSRRLAEQIVETLARLRDEPVGAASERNGRNQYYGCVGR